MSDLYKEVEELLLQNNDYKNIDNTLNKQKVIQSAKDYSGVLLEYLYFNKRTKKHFFITVKDVMVFKQQEFIDFIQDKNLLDNNYTKYKNSIGLSTNADNKYLKQNNDVVLSFPFKDCVLAGGQSTKEEKRNEIFYNQVLAPEEIDRLLDPKVFTKAISYGVNGAKKETTNFTRNSEGTITDNLLIKGNNLLALHSLKEQFKGKVKLIYIDPPYNTGNDDFKYNDNFNHSTWLVFMKNRLEIARQLLADDGVIFVQCDDNEQAYLKVLMDEVFGRENFVSNSIVIINRGGRDYGGIAKTHEYILIYNKNIFNDDLNLIPRVDKRFAYEDDLGGFDLMELRNRNILFNDKNRPNLCYPFFINPENSDLNDLYEVSLCEKDGFIKLMPLKSQGIQTVWRWGKEKVLDNINIDIKAKLKKDGQFMIVQKYRKLDKRQRSVWDDKEFVNERGTRHIKNLFNNKNFAYPKPEYLLERIIQLATKEGDLVLDFFAGSGTTGAVAHKMGRQWIMVEQMDYIEDVTKARMQKVIDGEQGGISKNANWQGGGSFIYMELLKNNQNFIDEINNANTTKEIENIKNKMLESLFINYKVDVDEMKKDFNTLDINQQKKILHDALDKNQLYVNYTERNDTMFNCQQKDIALSENFYKKGE